jgi:hypothetical protein
VGIIYGVTICGKVCGKVLGKVGFGRVFAWGWGMWEGVEGFLGEREVEMECFWRSIKGVYVILL